MSPKTMPSAAMASRVAGHRGFGDSPGLDMRRPTLAASWLEPASMKTNAARLLDTLNIRYELRTYPVDPDDLSAVGVAEKVGLPAGQLFKTLVCRGDRTGVCLAVLPADRELDLKALARARGDRRFDTVPLREIQPLTGYVRGGVTALAGKREYRWCSTSRPSSGRSSRSPPGRAGRSCCSRRRTISGSPERPQL
jgi:Cys-tRNA(Pro) deacylase